MKTPSLLRLLLLAPLLFPIATAGEAEDAKALWEDPGLIILPSRFPDEPRHLAIGTMNEKHHTAIFTERDDSIRIISVRRSRENEKQLYESNQP